MLEFLDGFDHYNDTTNARRKWDSTSFPIGASFIAGRFGGNAVNLWNSAHMELLQGQLSAVATRTIGFAILPSQTITSGQQIVAFMDAGNVQVDVQGAGTGTLRVTRNGTVLATSTQTLVTGVWAYLEFQATISSSAGAYNLKVNGVSWVSATGVNTQATANASTNGVKFFDFGGSTSGAGVDDLYILNSSGSVNNNFLGECRILTSLPAGDDASFKQWTPSTGTNHWANVDDNPPNDDTDYNADNTAGHIDLFTFPAIAPTGAVAAVQTVLTARKDDVGTRQISEECRYSSVNYNGANVVSLPSGYGMFREIREKDPTGAAWTGTSVNAAEFGVKLVL